MGAVIFLLITTVSAVSQENSELGQGTQILLNLAANFTSANNDFTNPRPNSAYFPFAKSRLENEKIKRLHYTNINSEEYAMKITGRLRTWRGFQDVDLDAAMSFVRLLLDSFSSLSSGLQTSFLHSTLSSEDLQKLPISWQYLLPPQFYDDLDMSGADFAKLVSSSPGNTALLYKIAMVVRDEPIAVKEQFVNNLNLPDQFREDLGYILGYRWGIEVEADATEGFTMSTLLHLPTDVIMEINEATFESLNLSEKLTDMSKWKLASTQSKVAWYTKFDKYLGWKEIAGTPRHVMRHGHLMSGAPLEKLRELRGQQAIETSLLADVLDRTNMNPLRVQEVWEALADTDREESFISQANKLDVSQILSHYKTITHTKHQHKNMLEDAWLSRNDMRTPWINMLAIGFNFMDHEEFVSWSQKQLLDLGKFVAILSPAELDMIPSANFNSSLLSSILSPALSLSQLTSIYKKLMEESPALSTINPILLSSLPSSIIMSPSAPFIWSKDKTNLLTASAMFSPAQMHSLHEITKSGHWSPGNLSTILSTHPQCMSDINPHEFRLKLDHVVTAIYTAGPANFHTIASKIQKLPRHLLMAWLEETHNRPGSQKVGKWWNSDVLLDRVTPTSNPEENFINPLPSHPLAAQFDRFTSANRSMLPSLALAGMSCHCIDLVETPDTLEVLALFRYHLESEGSVSAMPSSARKCWAKKVRQFLQLKAILFNVTVNSEPELLSLLTTSDIKTIGGEILLTWGGPALASITHPEVMHEVLMAVGHTVPHLYVRNGVTYECMVVMANAMLDVMIKEEGKINLRVLTHVHNLMPYTDNRVLEASPEDIKLFISTVLRPMCKAVCLKRKERELVREMILKSYGLPNAWLPLDLVELGDLMMVMARSDLAAVNPTSLRLAAAQLSSTTLYTTLLSDVRASTKPVLYHDACGAWLGGKEGRQSHEAIQMYSQWNTLAEFIMIGSFLQVEVLMNEMVIPKPRSKTGFGQGRRKRQATDEVDDGIDYKRIYSLVMTDMKKKFDDKELTDNQKTQATKVITETQKMLGDTSFAVLGLERGDKSQSEVLAVLAEYKDAGNMTEEQNIQVQKLAVDTQVRMIQELVGVLGLTATDMELTDEQLDTIMLRHTFVLKPPGDVRPEANNEDDVEATELLVESEETTSNLDLSIEAKEAPDVTTNTADVTEVNAESSSSSTESTALSTSTSSTSAAIVSTTSTQSSSASSSSTVSTTIASSSSSTESSVTSSTSVSAKSSTASTSSLPTSSSSTSNLNTLLEEEAELTDFLSNNNLSNYMTTFKVFEPASDYFTSLPNLDTITLSCDVLIAAGPSASSISSTHIASMSSKEVTNCLDILGHLPWPQAVTESIWEAVKNKVTRLQGVGMLPIKRQEMLQLQNLLPAIASVDSELLDMDRKNIDGISYLGRNLQSDDHSVLNLIQLFITVNEITNTNPFTSTEAAALGQLLCGLREEQWDLVTPDVFSSILTEHLSQLDCVTTNSSHHMSSMLTTLYGSTSSWTSSDLLSIGWVASTLSPDKLSQLKHHAMEGLTGHAVKHLSREQLGSLSHHQLSMMSPHAASFISRDQLMPFTNMHRRRGIRAAGGEDEKLVDIMEKIEPDMQIMDMTREGKTDALDVESTGGVGNKSSSFQLLVAALVFMMVFGV